MLFLGKALPTNPPRDVFLFAPAYGFSELARVFVRFDHVASFIINANHGTRRAAVELRIPDCILDRIRLAVPQPTEWQCIANQIDAAMIFARADFVNMHRKPFVSRSA